jgi:hypothetical protein
MNSTNNNSKYAYIAIYNGTGKWIRANSYNELFSLCKQFSGLEKIKLVYKEKRLFVELEEDFEDEKPPINSLLHIFKLDIATNYSETIITNFEMLQEDETLSTKERNSLINHPNAFAESIIINNEESCFNEYINQNYSELVDNLVKELVDKRKDRILQSLRELNVEYIGDENYLN